MYLMQETLKMQETQKEVYKYAGMQVCRKKTDSPQITPIALIFK